MSGRSACDSLVRARVGAGVFALMVPLFDILESDERNLTVLKQGEMPDAFYILAKGTVVVEVDARKVIATLEGLNPEDLLNSYPFFGAAIWWKTASAVMDDTAPSARPMAVKARAAPMHPGAPPEPPGSVQRLQAARLRPLRR